MGSASNTKAWVPYMKNEDCSQGFCSFYCPQWCYMILPPPPPAFQFPDDASARNFSPLVIAIIGILGSAFLLLSYYTMISKYCGNTRTLERESHDQEAAMEEGRHHEPWHGGTGGLDEALIKSITVLNYKKGDRLVEGTDCSVCLSEFEEDESLRLLPKCSHAFHMQCIDTWLGSHSNCPLCRACVVPAKPESPLVQPVPVAVAEQVMESSSVPNVSVGTIGDIIMDVGAGEEEGEMRRSVSMSQSRVSVADILCISESEEGDGGGSSEQELNKSKTMKRSFSSGRFFMSSRHQCGV